MSNPQTPADAVPQSWVDSMPGKVQPYLRLARLDRPIGTWLLFWPCVWGLVLAQGQAPDWRQLVVFMLLMCVGSLVMRGAGCAYNDIVDRDMDAQVARTRGRPLPAGLVTVRQAWIFLALLALIGLAVLLQFNRAAIITGLSSLLLVAAYPFMKRLTWWPQAWLGLTFNWGALVGWVAVTGKIETPALLLYASGFFWTLGYDTIYALQDVEDDALAGVKSSARALGRNAARGVLLFYVLASLCLSLALYLASARLSLTLLVIPVVVHFLLQVMKLQPDNAQRCLQLFKSNRDAGLLMALACLAALVI
jgi:4-hydroxybenzoate polyprenyltransferase